MMSHYKGNFYMLFACVGVDDEDRPYIPRSCCIKDKLWRYVNLHVCQRWRLGPPGSPVDGAINRAVYYTVSSIAPV